MGGLPAVRLQVGGPAKPVAARSPGHHHGRVPTPPFVPALELSHDFYFEVVAPLLRDQRHTAASLGTSSEVLGY